MSDAKATCQPQIVSAEFTKHMQECQHCRVTIKLWNEWKTKPGIHTPCLCEKGRKVLAAIFN